MHQPRRRIRAAGELTLYAVLLAAFVWVAVGLDVLSPGPLGRFSKAHKGNDFVQFYVMGSLARTGDYQALADEGRFRTAQAGYIIPGPNLSYPPVYGPHVAIALQPLAWFEYQHAYALFSSISLLLFAASIWLLWRSASALRPWGRPTAAVAAAFPALGYLVLNGQLSALAVAALALMVVGLRRRSRLLTGLALGVLGYKFSLLAPALAVCLLAGEWTIGATGAAVVVLQLAGASHIAGVDVVRGFFENTVAAAQNPDILARKPYMMGSLRTFWTGLLPPAAAQSAYAITAAGALGLAAWAWRRTREPLCRVGLLSLAIALTTPHFYMYDLVIVAPAFVASAALLLRHPGRALRWTVAAAYLSPLAIPAAAATGVQFVTIALAGWLLAFALHRDVIQGKTEGVDGSAVSAIDRSAESYPDGTALDSSTNQPS